MNKKTSLLYCLSFIVVILSNCGGGGTPTETAIEPPVEPPVIVAENVDFGPTGEPFQGSFNLASNWSLGVLPGSVVAGGATSAFINNGDVTSTTEDYSSINEFDLYVADIGSAELTISHNLANIAQLLLNNDPTQTGDANISHNSGTVSVTGATTIGGDSDALASGQYTLTNQAILNTGNLLIRDMGTLSKTASTHVNVSGDLTMTRRSNLSFSLNEVTVIAIDVDGTFSIDENSTLDIDASIYTGGEATIPLVTFSNRAEAFLSKNVRVNGLELDGKGLVGSIIYDDDSMDLVISTAYSETAEGFEAFENIKFSWDNVPRGVFIAQNTEFDAEEFDYLAANYSTVTFGINYAGSDIGNYDIAITNAARELKARNANIKVLYYISLARLIRFYPANDEFLANPDWIPEDDRFAIAGTPTLDWRNRDMAQWWVNRFEDALEIPNVDGVFVDEFVRNLTPARLGVYGIDWENGIYWALQKINIIAQASGRNPLIMGNVILRQEALPIENWTPYFNGVFIEGLYFDFNQNTLEDDFETGALVRSGIARTDVITKDGKLVLTNSVLAVGGTALDTLAESQVQTLLEDLAERRLALFLLTAQEYSFYDYKEGQRPPAIFRLDGLAEFTQDLGAPLGDFTVAGNIYTREFEHCTVTVNTDNMLQTGIICNDAVQPETLTGTIDFTSFTALGSPGNLFTYTGYDLVGNGSLIADITLTTKGDSNLQHLQQGWGVDSGASDTSTRFDAEESLNISFSNLSGPRANEVSGFRVTGIASNIDDVSFSLRDGDTVQINGVNFNGQTAPSTLIPNLTYIDNTNSTGYDLVQADSGNSQALSIRPNEVFTLRMNEGTMRLAGIQIEVNLED